MTQPNVSTQAVPDQAAPNDAAFAPDKERYHAPHLKIHGKLERLTLQAGTSLGGGSGGVPTDPGGLNG